MYQKRAGAVSLALVSGLAVTGAVISAPTAAAAEPAARVAGAGETPVAAQAWTHVSQKYPARSYWQAAEDLRVGNEGSAAQGLTRSYVRLDTSRLKGATVNSATFRIANTGAPSCTAKPVELWSTGAVSAETTWRKQPARGVKLSAVSAAKGRPDCAAGEFVFDATALVKEAAAKNLATVTVGLFAANESDTGAWKRFAPTSVKLDADVARPTPPVIASAEYPDGKNGWPAQTGTAGTAGTFTFGVGGAANTEKVVYWTDFAPAEASVAPGAAVSLTPPSEGPHSVYAYSVDKAGYRSDTATCLFYANKRPGGPDRAGDLNGDGLRDVWSLGADGRLRFSAGRGDGTFAPAVDGGITLVAAAKVVASGDWSGHGHNDLVAMEYNQVERKNKLWVYPNPGTGVVQDDRVELTVTCPVADPDLGCETADDHWYNAEDIVDAGDLNADGAPDLLVKQGKELWAYYGNGMGLLDVAPPVLVGGADWDTHTVVVPGDTSGDGVADLWLRDNASGDVSGVNGVKGSDGKPDPAAWGVAANRVKIGSGIAQAAYPALGSSGDLTGDGRADLWAVTADGKVVAFRGTAAGLDGSPVSGG
ncbi:FG-GAP-like repeat-containing protein [Streptomyces sp. NBC_01443]|uniref:FG-GAP-like repeat-containing protein n=1 Tax=Streptomyces sp. NBC_01443 TaxID=2903868 RepID=UPI00225B0020|nr:FG-GAP-like repeat-containing protein [Streptomyces sp. NBC_01443]MCX4626345.1 DNRLRE domain-containing protein [Streptomyces sp. NBC_01443]